MMTSTIARILLLLCAGSVCFCSWAAADGSTNTAPFELEFETSVFVYDDLEGTRDPFFPESTRRTDKLIPDVTPDPIEEPDVESLQLRGFMGVKRRVALINNRTFEVGDELEVKVGNGSMMVKCLEFRQESVVISVDGTEQKHELFVNAKVLPIKPEEDNNP